MGLYRSTPAVTQAVSLDESLNVVTLSDRQAWGYPFVAHRLRHKASICGLTQKYKRTPDLRLNVYFVVASCNKQHIYIKNQYFYNSYM